MGGQRRGRGREREACCSVSREAHGLWPGRVRDASSKQGAGIYSDIDGEGGTGGGRESWREGELEYMLGSSEGYL